MEIIRVKSWQDFITTIEALRKRFGIRQIRTDEGSSLALKNDVLFRGQADFKWGLDTTLERSHAGDYSIVRYLQRVDSVVNELETHTGKRWSLSTYPEYRRSVDGGDEEFSPNIPSLDLLVYLRHHGFPSPLLDWTRSPLIAAFFAFEPQSKARYRSVYTFIESPDGGKAYRAGDTYIHTVGRYLTADTRHFSQKAQYSYAVTKKDKKWYFTSHGNVTQWHNGQQDYIVRIDIPSVCRSEILRELDDCNINMYTLFGGEDALIRSLGLHAFDGD